MKDLKEKDSLIVMQSNGTLYGGLKGNCLKFLNERTIQFKCSLDLDKKKFTISGKYVHIEKNLDD